MNNVIIRHRLLLTVNRRKAIAQLKDYRADNLNGSQKGRNREFLRSTEKKKHRKQEKNLSYK